jgi:NSS family neurotransmitter:Na+ symporter
LGSSEPHTPTPTRARFSSKLAFILAASSSAIGLGNLWRFPALAARYGGGAFLVTYLVLVATFGFALMMAEVALGRRTGLSATGAFRQLGKRYAIIGTLASLVPMIITPYYCVIGGWVAKYFAVFVTGSEAAAADGGPYFSAFIGSFPEPVLWTLVFALVVMLVVGVGLKNGIERVNKVFMPVFLVLALALGLYALTIPGALDGLAYFVIPHLEDFGLNTVVAAMGQMFFSLSLAMGIMITYGSYMRKEDDLEQSVHRIEFFDTLVALLAGLMIIPAVFAFSGVAGAQQAGPGLMFVTMPQVFVTLPLARVLGGVFFLLVLFAALTSAISLAETVVSILMDRFHWTRRKTVLVVTAGLLAVALLPTLGFSLLSGATVTLGAASMTILDLMDFVSNNLLMPLVALLTCLFVGYWVGPRLVQEEVESTPGVRFKGAVLFKVMIRYVAPAFLLVILISSVLNTLGVITL